MLSFLALVSSLFPPIHLHECLINAKAPYSCCQSKDQTELFSQPRKWQRSLRYPVCDAPFSFPALNFHSTDLLVACTHWHLLSSNYHCKKHSVTCAKEKSPLSSLMPSSLRNSLLCFSRAIHGLTISCEKNPQNSTILLSLLSTENKKLNVSITFLRLLTASIGTW